MSRISTQSIFHSSNVETSWQSYAASSVVHGAMIAAALAITIPVAREIEKPHERFTLVAPVLPEYRIKPPQHIQPPKLVARKLPTPLPKPLVAKVKPPEVKPIPPPQIIATAPKVESFHPVERQPEPKLDIAPPKPLLRTGDFRPMEAARAPAPTKKLAVGGFGDPNGVKPNDTHANALLLAKVGAFDSPIGTGQSGGGGKSESGGVRQGAFGNAGDAGGVPRGNGNGAVHTGGFGDAAAGASPGNGATRKAIDPASVTTPVEILYKPKPAYSAEARSLHLEGQVSVEVVFTSSGSVRVLRVVRGLGHGLDEAAEQAAMQVRFKPATRGGVPVDTSATINITFELT